MLHGYHWKHGDVMIAFFFNRRNIFLLCVCAWSNSAVFHSFYCCFQKKVEFFLEYSNCICFEYRNLYTYILRFIICFKPFLKTDKHHFLMSCFSFVTSLLYYSLKNDDWYFKFLYANKNVENLFNILFFIMKHQPISFNKNIIIYSIPRTLLRLFNKAFNID